VPPTFAFGPFRFHWRDIAFGSLSKINSYLFPLADGADNFFLQIPRSHGMGISTDQWTRWREWLSSSQPKVSLDDPIHEMFAAFAADEWFPSMTHYLAATDQFFVYPCRSLSTNMGEDGTHFSSSTNYFQCLSSWGSATIPFVLMMMRLQFTIHFMKSYPRDSIG